MVLNGKGSMGTVFFLNRSMQYSCLFSNTNISEVSMYFVGLFVVSIHYSGAVEEKWRTTSSVS